MNKRHYGQIGGLVTAHTSMKQHDADLKEVATYLASHPGASERDVAMCCNMSDYAARRLMRAVVGDVLDQDVVVMLGMAWGGLPG